MTEEQTKMSAGRKIVIVLIVILLLLTAAVYGYGVHYFTNHFLPGSLVNGWNCSYMTVDEAQALLKEQVGAYVLTVNTRNNGQESITAAEAGLTYVSDNGIQDLMKEQNRFRWFLAFNQKQTYTMTAASALDKEKSKEAVLSLKCMQKENTVEPTDAYVQDADGVYEIAPETEGISLDRKKTLSVIREAISSGKTSVNLEEEGCYKKPAVYRDDERLLKDCEQMNQISDVIITYDFGDRTERVDRDVIKDWFTRDENGDITLDRDLVAEYVNNLGYKYDTFGCTRTFRTYDGREKIITGGDYGWAIDQPKETDGLIEAILSGETQVREPVYAYKGWSRNTNDIGYTYLEIDLTNQRMVFYKDGYPLVDTLVVTGNPNIIGCATPTGCYAIDAMKSPAVLTGEDYSAPVTYWMPFAGNVGVHDATWRTEFGANLYMFEGSHGCVNTPYDKAAVIYQNIDVGAPVVVYE